MPHKVPEVPYDLVMVCKFTTLSTSEVSPYMLPALRIHLIR